MGIEATVGWVQCGRAFSEQVIEQIRETVAYLPRLSRRELASTACEHLQNNWGQIQIKCYYQIVISTEMRVATNDPSSQNIAGRNTGSSNPAR